MGTLRRLLRWAAWGLAGLAVCVGILALAGVAIDRGLARERVRALVERSLRDALGTPVHLGALEGVLHDAITVRDVRVGPEGEEALTADALEIDLDLAPLLGERRLVVERLVLRGASLSVVRSEDGRWRVEGLPSGEGPAEAEGEPGAPPPVTVEIREAVVEEARARVRWTDAGGASDLRGGLHATARDWVLPGHGRAALPRTAQARLALETSVLRGRPVEEGRLAAELEGNRVRLLPSALAGPFGRVEAEGEAELATDAEALALAGARLHVRTHALDLAVLTGRADLASRVDSELDLTTPAAPAGEREMLVRARVAPSALAGLTLDRASVDARLRLADRAWRLIDARVESPAGRLVASGRGQADRLDRLVVDVAALDLAALPEAWRGGEALAGRVDASAELSGPARDPRGAFELAASELARGSTGPVSGRLSGALLGGRRVELREGAVVLAEPAVEVRLDGTSRLALESGGAVRIERLGLRWPDAGTVVLTGRLRGDRADPLRAEVTALDVGAVAALAAPQLALGGTLDAQLVARGRLVRPVVEGAAVWEAPRLEDVRAERALLQLAGDPRTFSVTIHLIEGGREALRADASVATPVVVERPAALLRHPATTVRARADAFELAWIAPLVPPRYGRPSGVATFDVTLRGADPRPELRGAVQVAEARFPVAPLGLTWAPVEANVRLDPERIEVSPLRIVSGEGEAVVTGHVGLDGGAAADTELALRFSRFALARTPVLRADLDGALRARGRVPAVHVAGELTLTNARIGLPEAEDPLLKEIRVAGLEEEVPTTLVEQPVPSSPVLGPATMDVRLRIPRNSWVEGRGLEAEVEGALEVRKEAGGEPIVLGAIEVVRGRYRFQGRTFRIERGVATFTGTRELDPELDFVAVQQVRDVTLRAVISGRASSPKLRLESEPPLDSTDLLSYLAFGRPAHELGSGESVRLESAATRLAGGLVAGSLVSALAPALPVDLLDVSLGENGPQVEVGKYLGERFFVRYARALGDTESDRVRIEWRFADHWSLESDLTRSGSAGADLVWTFDY